MRDEMYIVARRNWNACLEGAGVLWLELAMLLEPENRFEPARRSSTRSAILRVMLSRCTRDNKLVMFHREFSNASYRGAVEES